jgi:uncharacterized protein (TIGR02391 family)
MHTVNLETTIRQDLWEAVKDTYQASNYRHSVIDAMHHLTDILRAKSNLDGDGVELVNGALGGKSPILKVNRLETETERKTQEGIAHILRGLYLGIRNPRSHEQWEDTGETADAIIHFISYLLDIIDKSEEPFTIPRFLDSVFDVYFVDSEQYAEGLVNEIPSNKRLDTLIEVFRTRANLVPNAGRVSRSILPKLSDEELTRFASVVSNELRSAQSRNEVRTILAILPWDFWPRISNLARQRTENLLIRSISEGEVDDSEIFSEEGILGAWAVSFIPNFNQESREEVKTVLVRKLVQASATERRYAVRFFMSIFPDIITDAPSIRACAKAIMEAVNGGDTLIMESLSDHVDSFPVSWRKEFAKHVAGGKLPLGLVLIREEDGAKTLASLDDVFG